MSARSPSRTRSRATKRATQNEGFLARLLDPIDWLTQTVYSILILLTFTLAFRIFKLHSGAGPQLAYEQVNELLITALGCTLAWGVIDGLMYALTSVFERGEKQRWLRQIQTAPTEQEGVDAIAAELDYSLEPITGQAKRQALYEDVLEHLRDSQPQRAGLKREDVAGALGCTLVAIIAVLPSLVPFVLIRNDAYLAIRASNVVSFLVLFICGYRWARRTGTNPWKTGLLLMFAGAIMMLIAIPLGG